MYDKYHCKVCQYQATKKRKLSRHHHLFHHSQNDLFVEGTTLTDIEDWLAFYFVRVNKKGKKFLLTKSMCHKILSNKKHKPKLNHKKITHFK